MSRPRRFDEHAVVDAAMHAFWDGGLATTSVDELLRATGLSRSSMYQCVGNREAWLERAVARYVDEQVASIERSFAGRPLGDALRDLLVDAACNNFEGRGCLLANGVNELRPGEGLEVVREGFARVVAALGAAIARAQPDCLDPTQRCVEVIVAMAGLRTLQRAGEEPARLLAAARRYADMLARGA